MQSHPAMQPEQPRSHRRQGVIKGLFFGGVLLLMVSLLIVSLAWDYMPARIQYLQRYVQSNFLPARAHPASVPTPVVAVAPEDALASLDLDSSAGEKRVEQKEAALSVGVQAEVDVNAKMALKEAEAASEEAEAASEEAQAASEEAEAASEEAEAASEEAETVPEEAEVALEQAEVALEQAEVALEQAEAAQEKAGATPEEAETVPEEAEATQEQPETAPEETEGAQEQSEESAFTKVPASAEEHTSVEEVAVDPIYALAGPKAVLNGIQHEYQGWNNCGPATLGMQLSFFGRPDKQVDTAPFLKPDPDDKNVSPDEMIAYAHSIGYGGQVVVGMDLQMLRTFTANGLPVIVESWFIPDPDDEMGHYLLLTGYDGETLTFYDSYNGPDVQEQADEFDELWKVFNRTAIVVWPPEQEELATAILGDLTDPQVMYERALATAHAEVKANPQDKYAWFNLGTNLTVLGNIPNAVKAFDTARSLELPWRMLWYQFGPYQAYFENAQYEELIALTTTTLESSDNLEESYYWRGRAQAALGEIDAARRDLEEAVRLNANFMPANSALDELP